MAKILSDKEIKPLLGSVILEGDKNLINPNGIELRLGKHVRFLSTAEERELAPGSFLKVNPGENIIITSLERIDFSKATVGKFFKNCMLMGFVTPTLTMMREGITQVATKVDAGFSGILSWGLRNSSIRDLILQYGEPIFKLTIFLLEGEETPEFSYGERDGDRYQDSDGIVHSKRKIPAEIQKNRLVTSSFGKIDPKKQLKEAGYPFDLIGTELINLHGIFEVVSNHVHLLKDQFEKTSKELSLKIEKETNIAIEGKMEEIKQSVSEEKLDAIFESRSLKIFYKVIGTLAGLGMFAIGVFRFLKTQGISDAVLTCIAIGAGAFIFLGTWLLTSQKRK